MKIHLLLCCLALPLSALAQPGPPDAVLEKAVHSYNAFGFKLLAETRKASPAGNVFQSPVGLELALSMVLNGARGSTLDEMTKALQLDGISPAELNEANKSLLERFAGDDQWFKLEVANGMWIRWGERIKPEFVAVNQKFYGAEVSSMNFSKPDAPKAINDWVSGHTHGKIDKMVDAPLDPDLRLIVLDAIYFKAAWQTPFQKQRTKDESFTLPGGQTVQHPRMNRTGRMEYLENEMFQAVALPYLGSRASLYVFLPKDNLDKFLQNLTPENWEQWMGKFTPRQGSLGLPRFKTKNKYDLKTTLREMGMVQAFTKEAKFGGISDEPLWVSWVRQKTYVDVNEEGTEAAAVSGAGMAGSVVRRETEPPFKMIVDKPFYIAIRENQTGAILFHGAIVDPR